MALLPGETGQRRNALNFVRLVLAALVIVSHTSAATGLKVPWGWVSELGGWAVNGFFAISGYLVLGSRLRMGIAPFLWRRVLRIMPAYWIVLFVTAFVFAPWSTLMTGNRYAWSEGRHYVVANSGLIQQQWTIGATLHGLPGYAAWNGSLWSLPYEGAAYLVVAVLFQIAWVRRHALAVTIVLFTAVTVFQPLAHGPAHVTTNLYLYAMRLGAFFLAGMLLRCLRRSVPLTPRGCVVAAPALAVCLVIPGDPQWWAPVPYAYLLLAGGMLLPIRLGAVNDISYGTYLYGFPCQQLVMMVLGAAAGWWGNMLVAMAAALLLAAASWFLVEKRALRLKNLRLRQVFSTMSRRTPRVNPR